LQLEMAAAQGLIQCYVRNDRLELTVPYEFYGQARAYEPDFVVRLSNGLHLLLEVKGAQPAEVAAKHQAAQRWVGAVNRWGQLGVWGFMVCHDPQELLVQNWPDHRAVACRCSGKRAITLWHSCQPDAGRRIGLTNNYRRQPWNPTPQTSCQRRCLATASFCWPLPWVLLRR